MKSPRHPYYGKPDYQFWKNIETSSDLDPVVRTSFRISPQDRVVTAGSCFAQHVARHITNSGMYHFVTEPGHPVLDADVLHRHNFGMFSARYGNIYTARQLWQTIGRAYGMFSPIETSWKGKHGVVVDPFRPQIQPGGFLSESELNSDREQHFMAIRQAFEGMDVFVFTLGLTEAWLDSRDGSVYPLAPGVAGGVYDETRHGFKNFTVDETVGDMRQSIEFIRKKNPGVRIIITVSPVPLNATALDRHVVVSTAYSKAVLRVAAQQICDEFEMADYFPSYEIITAPSTRGRYFADDARSVLEEGVEHVMTTFFRHYRDGTTPTSPSVTRRDAEPVMDSRALTELLCDEEAINNF